ncbi:hypothetical protein Tco_1248404, partial [Tanacetum coccineum]
MNNQPLPMARKGFIYMSVYAPMGLNKNVVANKVDMAKDVVQDDSAMVVKESVAKEKPKRSASSVVVNKDNREGVNDKVLGVVAK